jgi:Ca2+-binding RTX toxin-like protein
LIGVIGTPAGTAVSLYAGSGRSTEFFLGSSVDGLDETQGPLAVHGTNTSDIALDFDYASPSSHTYTLSAPNPTTTVLRRDGAAAITHDGIGELLLRTAVVGRDTVKVQSTAFAPAIFVDGGSNSTLDYSSFTGDVTVNLRKGTATALAGISGIENVIGSIGNDILVGDANPNYLKGGTGRNLIIGGAGGDTLLGGGGDNILVDGTTLWDTNPFALQVLMNEWLLNIGIDQRINAIRRGIVVNNQTYALNANTVTADATPDSLIGGPGQNWFLFDNVLEVNNGAGPGMNDRWNKV